MDSQNKLSEFFSNPSFNTLTHHIWSLELNKEMNNLEKNHPCWIPSSFRDSGGLSFRIIRTFCRCESSGSTDKAQRSSLQRSQFKVDFCFPGHALFSRLRADHRGKHNPLFALGTQMYNLRAMCLY